ncbi:MAG: hypothetical protein ACQEQ5_08495 [Thermodesulfobacteriota bacterium]
MFPWQTERTRKERLCAMGNRFTAFFDNPTKKSYMLFSFTAVHAVPSVAPAVDG